MADTEQRARDLLACAYDERGLTQSAALLRSRTFLVIDEFEASALSAIRTALASQAQVPEARRDAERLDWLEGFVRRAYFYGGSFDFAKSAEGERGGYRFMSRGRLGQRHSTIRQAIDAAMAVPPAPEADRG